jgi:hypothetical protein
MLNLWTVSNVLFTQYPIRKKQAKLIPLIFVTIGILLTCRKHLNDHIISLRGKTSVHKTNLILPLFIEVPVPSQESERLFI